VTRAARDLFSAELQQPVVVDGWVVARRGQTVVGRVAHAKKAGRIKGTSELGIELTQLVLVDGQQIPLRTQFMNASGGTSQGRDAQGVGTAAGTGAVIGAISRAAAEARRSAPQSVREQARQGVPDARSGHRDTS
jgi:hypothetical protein